MFLPKNGIYVKSPHDEAFRLVQGIVAGIATKVQPAELFARRPSRG
jgi:hypothetical protein